MGDSLQTSVLDSEAAGLGPVGDNDYGSLEIHTGPRKLLGPEIGSHRV